MAELFMLVGELALTLVLAILHFTWWALVFLYQGLMAAFSPRHRERFLKHWRESNVSKATIVLLTVVGLALISATTWFWTHVPFSPPPPEPPSSSVLTDAEKLRLLNTEGMKDLAAEAGKIAVEKFQSTWDFRPSKKPAAEKPQPTAP